MTKKMYEIIAQTQRRYLLKATGLFFNENDARIKAYQYIIAHSNEVGFKPDLYIKIIVNEVGK